MGGRRRRVVVRWKTITGPTLITPSMQFPLGLWPPPFSSPCFLSWLYLRSSSEPPRRRYLRPVSAPGPTLRLGIISAASMLNLVATHLPKWVLIIVFLDYFIFGQFGLIFLVVMIVLLTKERPFNLLLLSHFLFWLIYLFIFSVSWFRIPYSWGIKSSEDFVWLLASYTFFTFFHMSMWTHPCVYQDPLSLSLSPDNRKTESKASNINV